MVGQGKVSSFSWSKEISIIITTSRKSSTGMDDQGVDYDYGWPRSILLTILFVIIMDGHGVLLVGMAKVTIMVMDVLFLVLRSWSDYNHCRSGWAMRAIVVTNHRGRIA